MLNKLMYNLVSVKRCKIYIYDIVILLSMRVDKTILKVGRFWPKHVKTNKLRGFKSASELYRRMSAKLVPTFADWWCRVVSATDPYGR
jgi:hypothetical protein